MAHGSSFQGCAGDVQNGMSQLIASDCVVQTGQTFEGSSLLKDDSCLYQHEAIRNSGLQRVSDGPANDIFPFQAFPCP